MLNSNTMIMELTDADVSDSVTKSSKSRRLMQEEVMALTFVNMTEHQQTIAASDTRCLLDRLEALCRQYRDKVSTHYSIFRAEYCALNIELNKRFRTREQGAMAPAFRPRLKHKKTVPGYEKLLSNDAQVIDLHLMYLNGLVMETNRFLTDATTGDEFNFDAAYRFAATAGSKELKLNELLALSEISQWQLATLKEPLIRKRCDALAAGKARIKNDLEADWRNKRYIQGNVDDWSAIVSAFLFAKLMYDHMKVEPRVLYECLRIMTGRSDLAPQILSRKLKSALKYLPNLQPVNAG